MSTSPDTTTLQGSQAAIAVLNEAAEQFAAKRAGLVQKEAECLARIERLSQARIGKEEAKTLLGLEIDRTAGRFAEESGWPELVRHLAGTTTTGWMEATNAQRPVNRFLKRGLGAPELLALETVNARGNKVSTLQAVLCLLCGDALKKLANGYIDAHWQDQVQRLTGKDAALTVAKRVEEIARLEDQVAKIRDELVANDQELANLPIVHKARAEARWRLNLPPDGFVG